MWNSGVRSVSCFTDSDLHFCIQSTSAFDTLALSLHLLLILKLLEAENTSVLLLLQKFECITLTCGTVWFGFAIFTQVNDLINISSTTQNKTKVTEDTDWIDMDVEKICFLFPVSDSKAQYDVFILNFRT